MEGKKNRQDPPLSSCSSPGARKSHMIPLTSLTSFGREKRISIIAKPL